MNIFQSKLPVLMSGVILSGLLSVTPVIAATNTSTSTQTKEMPKKVESTVKKAAAEKMEKFSKEAAEAIQAVVQSINLLDKGKKDEAIKKLEIASGKLEVAMAAEPSLGMVPVAMGVSTYGLFASPKQVDIDLDTVDDLIDDGDVQAARALMNRLHSEVVTETTYIPVETYPGAIKRAVKEIANDQTKTARETLVVAMDSLFKETVITPLPIVLAHGAIKDAEQILKTEKSKALNDLDFASNQIETARALGYFFYDKAEYEAINKTINDLRNAINGKSKTEKLFDKVKNSMKKLLAKFEHTDKKPAAKQLKK